MIGHIVITTINRKVAINWYIRPSSGVSILSLIGEYYNMFTLICVHYFFRLQKAVSRWGVPLLQLPDDHAAGRLHRGVGVHQQSWGADGKHGRRSPQSVRHGPTSGYAPISLST